MRWIVPLLLVLAPTQAVSAQPVQASSSDRMSYVYLTADGSDTMNGSTDDFQRARALQNGHAPLLYIRERGAAYVIRDPALLRRADEIMRPQQELGRRQGELGSQQGELGARQGALGAEQGRLGAMMADARVSEMDELGRRQEELGRQQAELGTQQAELGRRQDELGRQQERAAALAQQQFRALMSEALQRGVAQRVN